MPSWMYHKKRLGAVALALMVLCLLAMLWAFCVGAARLSLADTIGVFKDLLIGRSPDPAAYAILFKVRLPRLLMSLLVGAALAASGACMQGLFSNPMADPHTLGVSSGAALGAGLCIFFRLETSLGGFALIAAAFLGGIGCVSLVYTLSRVQGRSTTLSLLLSGVAVSSLATAGVSLLMLLARDQMDKIVFWTMGSLASASYAKVAISAPLILLGMLVCLTRTRELNAMLLGDEQARSLGVPVEKTRRIVLAACTLMTAAAVGVSGIIGFVGLMVPHALRFLVGADHRALLPFSAFGGGLFLLVMDTLSRTMAAPIELPVGVLTAVLGGPFFLYLMRKQAK